MKKRKSFSVSTLTGWVSLVLQCVLAKVSVHPGQINRQVTFLQNLAGYDKIASWDSSYLGRCKSLSSLRHWNNIQALACFGRNFCLSQKCYQMAQCDASVNTDVTAHTEKKRNLDTLGTSSWGSERVILRHLVALLRNKMNCIIFNPAHEIKKKKNQYKMHITQTGYMYIVRAAFHTVL